MSESNRRIEDWWGKAEAQVERICESCGEGKVDDSGRGRSGTKLEGTGK